MALLVMHFPKLRILWSKAPHETLKVFRELKCNHDEVDVARAVEVGQSDSIEALLSASARSDEAAAAAAANKKDDDEEDEVGVVVDDVNEAARDMLLRLPGVNVPIARRIMQECDCLSDLVEMSRDDLRKLAGPNVGQRLFTFFRQKLDPSAA
jgi:DNA excision repair protein ERCC-4